MQQMELEARSAVGPTKEKLKNKLESYKKDMLRVRGELKEVRTGLVGKSAARDELFGGAAGSTEMSSTAQGQRERVANTTKTMEESGQTLQEAKKVAVDTLGLGTNILGNLHTQRGVIESAGDHLHGADSNVARAGKVLRAMGRRVMTNKLIMFLIVLVLLGAIGLVVYLQYIQ